jgi:ADP-ribose pyrophosphatase
MKVISSVEKYRCELFWVSEEHALDPSGFEIRRSIVHHRGSAVMLAVDERKRILLVRQFRVPARRYLWELPAGRLDEGETPLQTAKRELIEETGYRAKQWKKLVSFYPSPGFVAEKMTIFLATGLTEGQATPMEDERIETRWFSSREIEDAIRTGKIIDA